jgi:hypothetical protein
MRQRCTRYQQPSTLTCHIDAIWNMKFFQHKIGDTCTCVHTYMYMHATFMLISVATRVSSRHWNMKHVFAHLETESGIAFGTTTTVSFCNLQTRWNLLCLCILHAMITYISTNSASTEHVKIPCQDSHCATAGSSHRFSL